MEPLSSHSPTCGIKQAIMTGGRVDAAVYIYTAPDTAVHNATNQA